MQEANNKNQIAKNNYEFQNNLNNNNNKLPEIKNKNTNYKHKKQEKTISSLYKKVNFFEKLNKKEYQKLLMQKEQTKEEINYMIKASKEIDNLIQNEKINDKIDMFKTDYAKKMYSHMGTDPDKQKQNLLEKDYFMDEKKKIVEKIGDVYSFQITKNANEKEKIIKGKINNENERFKKRIVDGKKTTMEEFFKFMKNNQVKLPMENPDKLELNLNI